MNDEFFSFIFLINQQIVFLLIVLILIGLIFITLADLLGKTVIFLLFIVFFVEIQVKIKILRTEIDYFFLSHLTTESKNVSYIIFEDILEISHNLYIINILGVGLLLIITLLFFIEIIK